jgi:hypothetical protein
MVKEQLPFGRQASNRLMIISENENLRMWRMRHICRHCAVIVSTGTYSGRNMREWRLMAVPPRSIGGRPDFSKTATTALSRAVLVTMTVSLLGNVSEFAALRGG